MAWPQYKIHDGNRGVKRAHLYLFCISMLATVNNVMEKPPIDQRRKAILFSSLFLFSVPCFRFTFDLILWSTKLPNSRMVITRLCVFFHQKILSNKGVVRKLFSTCEVNHC